MLGSIGDLAYFSRFDVQDHQSAAAFHKCQFLAVGRVLRIATVYAVVLEQGFLFNQRGVCQVGLVLAHYGGGIDVPVAVSLRSIGNGAVVCCKSGGNFRLSGLCDALGGGVIHCGDEQFATRNSGNHFAVRRYGAIASAAYGEVVVLSGGVVRNDFNAQFLGLLLFLHGVDFTIVTETQHAVVGGRKEAHGVGLERGYLLGFRGLAYGHLPYVEGAALFAQVVEALSILGKVRVAVLAFPLCLLGVFARGGVVEPDVACDGRGVVLAPLVFAAFPVLVEEGLAVFAEADELGRSGQHLFIASAFCWDSVQLLHRTLGKKCALCGVGNGGAKVDGVAIV